LLHTYAFKKTEPPLQTPQPSPRCLRTPTDTPACLAVTLPIVCLSQYTVLCLMEQPGPA